MPYQKPMLRQMTQMSIFIVYVSAEDLFDDAFFLWVSLTHYNTLLK